MKRALLTTILLLGGLCVPADAARHHKKGSVAAGQSRLVGHVVSADGRRAGHARVTVRHPRRRRGRMHPHVDAAGRFSLNLKPGNYVVLASHHSMGSGRAAASLGPSSAAAVVVRLSGHGHHAISAFEPHRLGVHVKAKPASSTAKGAAPTKAASVSNGKVSAPSAAKAHAPKNP